MNKAAYLATYSDGSMNIVNHDGDILGQIFKDDDEPFEFVIPVVNRGPVFYQKYAAAIEDILEKLNKSEAHKATHITLEIPLDSADFERLCLMQNAAGYGSAPEYAKALLLHALIGKESLHAQGYDDMISFEHDIEAAGRYFSMLARAAVNRTRPCEGCKKKECKERVE